MTTKIINNFILSFGGSRYRRQVREVQSICILQMSQILAAIAPTCRLFNKCMFHGGVCFLVSIYVALQAALFAGSVKMLFGVDHLAYIVLIVSVLVIVAQYFEPPHIGFASRVPKSAHFMQYMQEDTLHLATDQTSPRIWQIPRSAEKDVDEAMWHPLTEVSCSPCSEGPNHAVRPPRARHCPECRECKMSWDHHCSFVNACIDESNFPAFYCFLLWSFYALAASKVLDIYTLVLWVMTRVPPSSEHDLAVLQLWTSWLPQESVDALIGLPISVKIVLGINTFCGIFVACFILVLLWQQTVNLVLNSTTPERTKYEKYGLSIPFNYCRYGTSGGLLKNLYKNIAFRVWRGPLMTKSRRPSIFDDNASFGISLLPEMLHVLACYTIPQYWRWSGEAKIHGSPKMMAKHAILPDDAAWTNYAKQNPKLN